MRRSRRSYLESRRMLDRLRRFDALANARPNAFWGEYAPVGGVPMFTKSAAGAYIWDADGNRYIDCALGYGSVVLGHADPFVMATVQGAAELGGNSTLHNEWHLALAEKFVEMVPAAEKVIFLRTGSDAVGAAVRLSRIITGRRKILHWGMHGWHDWCAESNHGVLGINRELLIEFRFNDVVQLENLVSEHGGDLAAIVMMPYEIDAPALGYLKLVQDLARSVGALFVLDEVRSGFRISAGGAQEFYDLRPDLSAFGKALGNGYCVSALAGLDIHMREVLKLGLTVTHYRSPDVMAAAYSTLTQICRLKVPERLGALGDRLISGLNDVFLRYNGIVKAVGFPATPFIAFENFDPQIGGRLRREFCAGMLDEGVLMLPDHHWFICASMSEDDIDFIVESADRVASSMNIDRYSDRIMG